MNEPNYICGADECGYGSGSGPLIVCGVRALKDWRIDGLRDSKKLSDKKRRAMYETLKNNKDIKYHIAERDNDYIDKVNVYVALKECYAEIANKLYDEDCLMIIDGNVDFSETLKGINYKTVIKADDLIPTVMAGSIIGKVYRDDLMIELDKEFPNYGWCRNKGYISKTHILAINKYGLTKYHRKSYKIKGI
jgi:ribonuclease HII